MKEIVICVVCAALFCFLFFYWPSSPIINYIDRGFFELVEEFTRASWATDTLITKMFGTDTAKLLPLILISVWIWFERRQSAERNIFLGQLLVGALLAMATSRLMQNLTANRLRPLHDPSLAYDLPYGSFAVTLEGWSSFPSDTSALGFAIATGIFLSSRRLGSAAFVWTILVVAFPRAYAGLHYPSDLLGGALIGVVCTVAPAPLVGRVATSNLVISIGQKWAPILYVITFLFLFQVATMFADVRSYGNFVMAIIDGL